MYSGTLVVHGQGVCVVKATGPSSEIGRIGRALQNVGQEETTLQRETRGIVRAVFIVALALFIAVVVVYGATRRD